MDHVGHPRRLLKTPHVVDMGHDHERHVGAQDLRHDGQPVDLGTNGSRHGCHRQSHGLGQPVHEDDAGLLQRARPDAAGPLLADPTRQ